MINRLTFMQFIQQHAILVPALPLWISPPVPLPNESCSTSASTSTTRSIHTLPGV